MLPGIQDFYDGMHHHLIHEMERALEASRAPADTASDHDHLARTAGDDHAAQQAAHAPHQDAAHHAATNDNAGQEHSHPFMKWVGEAALEVAVELASELVLAPVNLADAATHHDRTHPLHVGAPHGDGFTHQTTGFTCAVVSQKMILDQFHLIDPHTGEPLSEAQLVYDATVNGWLTDHGTNLGDLNKLLEFYGVSSHAGHDWRHLVGDLAAGHQVVIAVNADELWSDHNPFSELAHLFGNSPNHAIVLKGLRVDDHGRVVVVVNDPGQADGAGVEYSLEHFQSAISSTHLNYVATDHAPPGWSPERAISQLAKDFADPVGNALGHATENGGGRAFVDSVSEMNEAQKTAFLRNL